ncbi:MAG TPA: quinohemoprotein amine dehydrogenase subunit alpha [Vicinamibacteria bacterium]|nr:quinohemoprotein amine dehydrogenase subunit alpha [Vicinamibacteria bacterium]
MGFRRILILTLSWFVVRPSTASEGIPVGSELVRTACGACHESDDQGRMSRISYLRKTPEGWQLTLKRMMRTAKLDLSPEQARGIVRYLADHHGLAPEEARPYFYAAENRPKLENIEDEEIRDTCVRCHLGARFLTQRRTKEEWELLKGMHIGYFPLIEFQTFRAASPLAGDSPSEGGENGTGWRADRVLDKLAKTYPLETPEWKRFAAKRSKRTLEGRWLLRTHQPGRGPASGVVSMVLQGEDYVYEGDIVLADGSRRRREGKGVLYAGYTWRGTSHGEGLGELREVLMLSEDGSKLAGRFFEGTFGELGLDVSLERLGGDPRIAAVWPRSAKAGAGAITVRILGANLEGVSMNELDLGQGIRVARILTSSPEVLTVELDVTPEALPGYRNAVLGTSAAVDAFAVYDSVDYVKVVPEEALARVGGVNVPKQYAKFEAVAYHRGADDEPLTADDVNLGTVPAAWTLEEYYIRHDDDDIDFVGTIDQDGFFTPNQEGPNSGRELNADNFGDVWVVASYTPPGSEEALRGRSRLVVTIPLYLYWDLFP